MTKTEAQSDKEKYKETHTEKDRDMTEWMTVTQWKRGKQRVRDRAIKRWKKTGCDRVTLTISEKQWERESKLNIYYIYRERDGQTDKRDWAKKNRKINRMSKKSQSM